MSGKTYGFSLTGSLFPIWSPPPAGLAGPAGSDVFSERKENVQ